MITDFGRNSFVTWTTGLVERIRRARMRPYRGLTKEGKWVYGYVIERFDNIPLENRAWIIPLRMGLRFFPGRTEVIDTIEVAPESVGQQIGKQDKKGQEIYQGDRIKQTGHTIGGTKVEEGNIEQAHNGRFFVRIMWESGMECHADIAEDAEVIGNIHQPKLLEQEDDSENP